MFYLNSFGFLLRYSDPETDVQGRDFSEPTEKRIALVVEDEEAVSRMIKAILEVTLKLDVTVVSNGLEGIRSTKNRDYDLIITDVRMPVMNGVDFYDWLCDHRPEMAERVLFITGDYGETNHFNRLTSSARPVLGKPFTLAALLNHCQELLD